MQLSLLLLGLNSSAAGIIYDRSSSDGVVEYVGGVYSVGDADVDDVYVIGSFGGRDLVLVSLALLLMQRVLVMMILMMFM